MVEYGTLARNVILLIRMSIHIKATTYRGSRVLT